MPGNEILKPTQILAPLPKIEVLGKPKEDGQNPTVKAMSKPTSSKDAPKTKTS